MTRLPRGGAIRPTAFILVALAATFSSTRGQAPAPDPLLIPEDRAFARLVDHRSGEVQPPSQTPAAAPRRTLDGHWVFATSATSLRISSAGGPLRSVALQDPYVDLCTTRSSTILLATPTPTPRLVEIDVLGNRIASWPLSLPPRLVEVDGAGRAWVAVDNPPQPLIQVTDAAGSSGLLGLPGRLGAITDIQADARGHVFVCGDGSHDVIEFDAALTQVATYALGADPARGVTALEIGPDGLVHALQPESGIWRIDATSGAVEPALARPVRVFGFDPEGQLWTVRGDRLFKLRDAGGRWIEEWSRDGLVGFQPVWEDIGGLGLAAVIAPGADSDGDGFANGIEVRRGSSPFAAASTPAFDLDVKLGAPAGGTLEVRTRGTTALAFVALSAGRGPAVAVPGIGNTFDLDPAGLLLAPIPIVVPGQLTIDVPSPLAADGLLWAQAATFPLAGMPAFSDFGAARLQRDGEASIVETFATGGSRDPLASSRGWSNTGTAVPAPLGGRGELGSFDHTIGVEVEPGVFEFDTDDQRFPAAVTLFGRDIRVTDGVFDFADFVVPAGVTVRFAGSKPAVIRARGKIRIDGELSVAGGDPDPDFVGASGGQGQARLGEPGAGGGAGGGDGGSGGDACLGDGAAPRFSGRDGDDALALAASGYAGMTGGTGGGGGLLFPADGLDASVQFNLVRTLTSQLAGGGGGGGFLGAGAPGTVVRIFTTVASDRGPDSRAGAAVPFVPRPIGTSSLDHFLVGGAGGGGGGSHAFAMSRVNLQFERREWTAGMAGAGGGGALALRAGDQVTVSSGALVSARGGQGADRSVVSSPFLPPSPGGGGSGGSLLIQLPDARALEQNGTLDLSGGRGSRIVFTSFTGSVGESVGGDGGHGQLRVEAPTIPNPTQLGNINGPPFGLNLVGQLADRDAWSGVQSTFYRAETLLDPDWLGFEIAATIDGTLVQFDDSIANRPNRPGSPIWFFVQGARLDAAGQPVATGPWVESMADLDGQEADAVRFLILFDTSVTRSVSVGRVTLRHAR